MDSGSTVPDRKSTQALFRRLEASRVAHHFRRELLLSMAYRLYFGSVAFNFRFYASQALGNDHPALFSRSFLVGHPHWIHSAPLPLQKRDSFDCWFRFQHTRPLAAVRITLHPAGLLVTSIQEPIRAVAPGQYAVFYSEGECLGSARIIETLDRPSPPSAARSPSTTLS